MNYDQMTKEIQCLANESGITSSVGIFVDQRKGCVEFIKLNIAFDGEQKEIEPIKWTISQAKEVRDFLTFALWKA